MVNTLGFLVRSFSQVFINIFEVGDEDIFNEMLILLNIVILQEYFVIYLVSLRAEVVSTDINTRRKFANLFWLHVEDYIFPVE